MKDLIISDVHQNIQWIEPFLTWYKKEHGYDRVIFLGDYFDDYNDAPYEARATALWLRESLTHSDRIHLVGNHDMPYMCPNNRAMQCPGWTSDKHKVVNEVMSKDDWDKLRPCIETQGWLLSHAGCSAKVFLHPINGATASEIVERCEAALERMKKYDEYCLEFGEGMRQGGIFIPMGGITWCRWGEKWGWDFQPIPGINQLMGHTIQNKPDILLTDDSENWCMDTMNKHIAVIEEGKITFSEIN